MLVTHQTPYYRPYTESGPNYTVARDENWDRFAKQHPSKGVEAVEKSANYFSVRARKQDVFNSVKRKDVPAKLPSGPAYELALKFAVIHFSYITSQPSFPEGGFEFVMNTSPGLPFVKLGHHDKASVFADKELSNWIKVNAFNLAFPVLDNCSDKQEFLPFEDLTRDEPKIRTTFGSSILSLIKESYLFDGQNKALVTHYATKSVKYGFSKQRGGFSALGKAHEAREVRFAGDITGMDRVVCLIPVYIVRRRLLKISCEFDEALFAYWLYFIANPYFLHPAGYIVRCKTGNHSGRKNTTTDNSIMLKIVNIYGRIKLFLSQGVAYKDITYSMVEDCTEESFYGDDSLCSIFAMTINMSLNEWKEFVRGYYADFGLVIKEAAFEATLAAIGERLHPAHSFLGSYFSFAPEWNMYIPSPRFGKICSSITQKPAKRLDFETYFQRLVAIVSLSYPNTEIFDALASYLIWFVEQNPADSDRLAEILNSELNLPAVRASMIELYTGYEAC